MFVFWFTVATLSTTAAVRVQSDTRGEGVQTQDSLATQDAERVMLNQHMETDIDDVASASVLLEPELAGVHASGLAPLADLVHARKNGNGISYGYSRAAQFARIFNFSDVHKLSPEPNNECAYTDVDWVPDGAVARAVIQEMKGTDWSTFQASRGDYLKPEHAIISKDNGEDFIHLYIGSSAYSMNVERCSRGAMALHDDGIAAEPFNTRNKKNFDVTDATVEAVKFTAGLAAAIALIPVTETAQTLYRGATEPPQTMIKTLTQAQASGKPFMFPGLASLTLTKSHAQSFMHRGPYGGYQGNRPNRGDQVLYEFTTKQAKDITSINPREAEWLLPPNQQFYVVSVTRVEGKYGYHHYEVKLRDAA
jgi:hypothetical protein